MNQWIAWCWNTYLTPPIDCACPQGQECALHYTRGHYGYGLLVGRVFIGLTLSRAL